MSNELNLSPASINNEGNWGAFVYQLNNEAYLGDMDLRFEHLKFIAKLQPILAAQIICGCFLPQEKEKDHVLPLLLQARKVEPIGSYKWHKATEYAHKFGAFPELKAHQNTALTAPIFQLFQNSTTLIVGLDPANLTQMVAIKQDNATGLITDVTNEKPEDDECTMYLVQKVNIKGAGKLDGVQVLDLLKDVCNSPERRETRENAGVTFEFWDAQLYENLNDYED